jgi:hypothetical protein
MNGGGGGGDGNECKILLWRVRSAHAVRGGKKKLTILEFGCNNRASDISPSVRTWEQKETFAIQFRVPEFFERDEAQTCVKHQARKKKKEALTYQNDAGVWDNPRLYGTSIRRRAQTWNTRANGIAPQFARAVQRARHFRQHFIIGENEDGFVVVVFWQRVMTAVQNRHGLVLGILEDACDGRW